MSQRSVVALDLERMARSIAHSYGDRGAVIVTVGDDGFRVGVAGLTGREAQDALCIAIHHNFRHMDGD